MVKINPATWKADKKTSMQLPLRCQLRCEFAAEEQVTLSAETADGTLIPVDFVLGKVRKTYNLENFSKLHMESKKLFGHFIQVYQRQVGEDFNDELPPAPNPPANILQRLRRRAFQELQANRENFGTGYEVDDDRLADEVLEDLDAQKQAAIEAEKAASESAGEAQSSSSVAEPEADGGGSPASQSTT